jgi:putative chitinase
MTPDQLAAATGCKPDIAARWAPAFTAAFDEFKFNNRPRRAMLVAQCAHESANFTRLRESLNYSAEALRRQWPHRFTPELADQVGRTLDHAANEVAIANIAYANRMGNGDAASGDGWRFRGTGPIQLTGRDMYTRAGAALHLDLVNNPDQLLDPFVGSRVAGWFFAVEKGLLPIADRGDVVTCTKYINGGNIGLSARIAGYERAMRAAL